jgi:hypothetical protein
MHNQPLQGMLTPVTPLSGIPLGFNCRSHWNGYNGGFAVVSLALAYVKSQVGMVSRLRWDAALYHPPGPQPPDKCGLNPLKGKRQWSMQAWANRADTPCETMEVAWYRASETIMGLLAHGSVVHPG